MRFMLTSEKAVKLRVRQLVTVTLFLISIFAIWNLVRFFISAWIHVNFPFSFYWYEDDALYQVGRLLEHKKLYVKPSIDYIPYIYPPLYYYSSLAVSLFVGHGLSSLRIVSISATVGTFVTIILFVYKETHSRIFGIIAAGFYAGFYVITKMWFDMARVDNLNIFFIMATMCFVGYYQSKIGYLLAGTCMALACLTKQTSISIFIALAIYVGVSNRRLFLYFMSSFFILYVGSTIALQNYFDGWYLYYVFHLPSLHSFAPIGIVIFFLYDLIVCAGLSIWVTGKYFFTSKSGFYRMLFAIGIGYSLLSRANVGADANSSLLMYSTQAVFVGIVLYKAYADLHEKYLTVVIIFIQFVWLMGISVAGTRSLHKSLVSNSDERELIAYVAKAKGDVLMTNHRDLQRISGKQTFAHLDTLNELLGSYGSDIATGYGMDIYEQFRTKVRNQEFSVLLLDPTRETYSQVNPLLNDIKKYYVKSNKVFGLQSGPYNVYVPRNM